MGRSSQEQARNNRSKIVEAASKLFRRFGVEGCSVAYVMQAAGMTAGGFYKHFESKDALVQEALLLSFGQSARFLSHIKEESGETGACSAIVQEYFAKRPLDQTCPILAFAGHVASNTAGPLARSAYRTGVKSIFSKFIGKDQHGEQDAKVMFAAMIGAGFLAHVLKDDKWVRAVQVAVETSAKRNAITD